MKLLLEHRERVRAWAKENPWHQRERDWTSFELGACVSWTTLYPSASLLTAFHEGFHHVFADMYCTNPACQCEEALLSVGRREGSASSAREVGLLRVSLQAAAEGELEVEKGDPVSLRGAYAELLASRPGVLSLFRRRKSAMRDFGRFMETKGQFFDVRARATQGTFDVEPYSLRESKILRESMIDERRPGIEDPRRRVIVSRNAPCPCGSGRKLKKCCGHAAGVEPPAAGIARKGRASLWAGFKVRFLARGQLE